MTVPHDDTNKPENISTVTPKVAVILVNWNGKADTLECLASLRGIEYSNLEIVVVDNGSHDDSASAIRAAFPNVNVIETGDNLGFTGGNNKGIEQVLEDGADYVFLLNNDTTIDAQAIGELVKAAQQNPDCGLLTPLVFYYDTPDEVWFGGARLDLARGIAVHDNSQVPRPDELRQLAWASGCTMFFPAEVLRRARGFDERFFLNWEDVDLSLRVRAMGFKIVLVPSAKVWHKVGRSMTQTAPSMGSFYYSLRNNLLLVSLHGGQQSKVALRAVLRRQLRERLRAIFRRRARSGKALVVALRAWNDFRRGRFGALNETA